MFERWRRPHNRPHRKSRRRTGVAIVEFALASLLFLPITLGTIDFGRAIFQTSQLENAVREGARYGKTDPPRSSGSIQTRVEDYGDGITLSSFGATYSASPCVPGSCTLTVTASTTFTPFTVGLVNTLLGGALPDSITLSASATVGVE